MPDISFTFRVESRRTGFSARTALPPELAKESVGLQQARSFQNLLSKVFGNAVPRTLGAVIDNRLKALGDFGIAAVGLDDLGTAIWDGPDGIRAQLHGEYYSGARGAMSKWPELAPATIKRKRRNYSGTRILEREGKLYQAWYTARLEATARKSAVHSEVRLRVPQIPGARTPDYPRFHQVGEGVKRRAVGASRAMSERIAMLLVKTIQGVRTADSENRVGGPKGPRSSLKT